MHPLAINNGNKPQLASAKWTKGCIFSDLRSNHRKVRHQKYNDMRNSHRKVRPQKYSTFKHRLRRFSSMVSKTFTNFLLHGLLVFGQISIISNLVIHQILARLFYRLLMNHNSTSNFHNLTYTKNTSRNALCPLGGVLDSGIWPYAPLYSILV